MIYNRFRTLGRLSIGVWLLLFTVWMLIGEASYSEVPVPRLTARVNDNAHMMTASTVRGLEARLAELEKSDSTQIAVLTVNSLDGEPIGEFSMRVAEAWKVGQKGVDNGALLIVSQKDRKLRIEVGYGLEGRLTDLISGQIIRNVIVPEFKRGNFDRGIISGVDAMISAVRGEYKGKPARKSSESQGSLFGIIAFIFLISQLGRANRGLGAVAGGLMLPAVGWLFFNPGLILLLLLFPMGLVAGLVLSVMGSAFGSASLSSGYRGGGYWGGGGGFSSGGGFGGFSGGGGGFGGGGASGGW